MLRSISASSIACNAAGILDRAWLLPTPATRLSELPGFHVIRDDLLHPIMGGNKLRKLDAVIPLLQSHGVTDVVTCGGCQSAHTAAVAVACAEAGMKAHLLLRGERPAIPTGYNLVAGMYGYVYWISRSEYADRHGMLHKYALRVAEGDPSRLITSLPSSSSSSMPITSSKQMKMKRVAIVNEGAGDCHAMLGLIRLVDYLSQPENLGMSKRVRIVVDCGTGTTAVGLALGIALLRLPWEVVGVMLADTEEGYRNQANRLLAEFKHEYNNNNNATIAPAHDVSDLPVLWQPRCQPRKFGGVLAGEVERCKQIARETGILLDPIYTLAGWDMATKLAANNEEEIGVALLHTGGTLGLFGLAQRYPLHFA